MTIKHLLLTFLLIGQSLATNQIVVAKDLTINQDMTKIGQTMTDLLPIIVNNKRFSLPSNQELIGKDIDRLIDLFAKVGPHFDAKSITYRVSYDVMFKHLQTTQSAHRTHNLVYTQALLRELVSICTSCHTQDNQSRTLFLGATRDTFDSDYHYAEFNYLTRNYPIAIEYYKRYLQAPRAEISEEKVLDTLRNLLIMQVQINQDPADALSTLTPYADSPKLSAYSRQTLHEWITGLYQLKKQPLPTKQQVSFKTIETLVHKYLGSLAEAGSSTIPEKPKQVLYIALRGLIYYELAQHPTEAQTPQLLYWLAVVDRSTRNSFYYSLSDLYLKECIVNYSKFPVAKNCYDEYEDYMLFSYSGSQGTSLPTDIQQEMDRLRKVVYPDEPKPDQPAP